MSQDHHLLPIPISSRIISFLQTPNSNSNPNPNPSPNPNPNPCLKRKRSLPGTPDPDAEVIALSPKSLMATNKFLCEICNKGFQRDQNLQLHRRGHNLPWKLKQRENKEVIRKKVYICPEKTCIHHDSSRALGDLTGIKKHFCRKHGEKKWKCDKCSKKYAVHSDWKAHVKICGTREYKCDCGTLFSRKDSFITHRAFCDVLTQENGAWNDRVIGGGGGGGGGGGLISPFSPVFQQELLANNLDANGGQTIKAEKFPLWLDHPHHNEQVNSSNVMFLDNSNLAASSRSRISLPELLQPAVVPPESLFGVSSLQTPWRNAYTDAALAVLPRGGLKLEEASNSKGSTSSSSFSESLVSCNNLYTNFDKTQVSLLIPHQYMSATGLLQKTAQMGSTRSKCASSAFTGSGFGVMGCSSLSPDIATGMFNSSYDHGTIGDHHEEIMWDDGENGNIEHFNLMIQGRGSIHEVGHDQKEEDMSLTRDFLGVGGDDDGSKPRTSLLQQEMAKFASLGSIHPWTDC